MTTSALQRMEAVIVTAFPSFPHPPSSLSGRVRNRTRRLSGDPATGLGRASAAGNDVDRASLHGDEHPGIPSGPATVASPPPGGGRHVLDERAA